MGCAALHPSCESIYNGKPVGWVERSATHHTNYKCNLALLWLKRCKPSAWQQVGRSLSDRGKCYRLSAFSDSFMGSPALLGVCIGGYDRTGSHSIEIFSKKSLTV